MIHGVFFMGTTGCGRILYYREENKDSRSYSADMMVAFAKAAQMGGVVKRKHFLSMMPASHIKTGKQTMRIIWRKKTYLIMNKKSVALPISGQGHWNFWQIIPAHKAIS